VVGSSGGCESIMMSGREDEMGRGEPIVDSADYEAWVMPKTTNYYVCVKYALCTNYPWRWWGFENDPPLATNSGN
jgi:hypothetical protein